ncbi:hypothetical protein [Kibdelosporangium phytohabitans]|uniref:Uncharacterized protein n=1 Tax=Kibdelosporangium phytohabitans TaxID=860235 RepID=A0A0N9HQU4_9PSEU|nr:hypothetical protein [Kibdelosporangium phytohabitans]ALG09537.1 hypothetical protein AOZ06_23875 [Kibdelosporangium phytohabitans]MBE1469153.1 hypothetical protein [Kibdelosporangium phytohabitans]
MEYVRRADRAKAGDQPVAAAGPSGLNAGYLQAGNAAVSSLFVQRRVSVRDVGRGEQSGFARLGELVERLNGVSTGLTFAVADGTLTYTPIEGGTLSAFDQQMVGFIDDGTVVPMRFTNRHGRLRDEDGRFTGHVEIDEWENAYVDIDDLLAASDVSLQTSLVHLLRERQVTRGYDRRIGSPGLDGASAEFDRAHDAGLDAELPIVRDFFGDPTIRFASKQERVYRNDRGDTLREVQQARHGANEGVEALDIRVTLHEPPHRVLTAEEYRDLLRAERAAAP